jgi:hypothetical protein
MTSTAGAQGAAILDLRSPEAFSEGHISGSNAIGIDGSHSTWGELAACPRSTVGLDCGRRRRGARESPTTLRVAVSVDYAAIVGHSERKRTEGGAGVLVPMFVYAKYSSPNGSNGERVHAPGQFVQVGGPTRAVADKVRILEKRTDIVLAARYTPVHPRLVPQTVETVGFTPPERIDFWLVRGAVPHLVEEFLPH